MNREDLIQLFDKNKEDIAKYEKNKKRIKDINELIRKIEKKINIKTTTTYKEAQSSPTNKINSAVENFVEQKESILDKVTDKLKEIRRELDDDRFGYYAQEVTKILNIIEGGI